MIRTAVGAPMYDPNARRNHLRTIGYLLAIQRDMLLYGHARRGTHCMVQPATGPVRFYATSDCPNCGHYRARQ